MLLWTAIFFVLFSPSILVLGQASGGTPFTLCSQGRGIHEQFVVRIGSDGSPLAPGVSVHLTLHGTGDKPIFVPITDGVAEYTFPENHISEVPFNATLLLTSSGENMERSFALAKGTPAEPCASAIRAGMDVDKSFLPGAIGQLAEEYHIKAVDARLPTLLEIVHDAGLDSYLMRGLSLTYYEPSNAADIVSLVDELLLSRCTQCSMVVIIKNKRDSNLLRLTILDRVVRWKHCARTIVSGEEWNRCASDLGLWLNNEDDASEVARSFLELEIKASTQVLRFLSNEFSSSVEVVFKEAVEEGWTKRDVLLIDDALSREEIGSHASKTLLDVHQVVRLEFLRADRASLRKGAIDVELLSMLMSSGFQSRRFEHQPLGLPSSFVQHQDSSVLYYLFKARGHGALSGIPAVYFSRHAAFRFRSEAQVSRSQLKIPKLPLRVIEESQKSQIDAHHEAETTEFFWTFHTTRELDAQSRFQYSSIYSLDIEGLEDAYNEMRELLDTNRTLETRSVLKSMGAAAVERYRSVKRSLHSESSSTSSSTADGDPTGAETIRESTADISSKLLPRWARRSDCILKGLKGARDFSDVVEEFVDLLSSSQPISDILVELQLLHHSVAETIPSCISLYDEDLLERLAKASHSAHTAISDLFVSSRGIPLLEKVKAGGIKPDALTPLDRTLLFSDRVVTLGWKRTGAHFRDFLFSCLKGDRETRRVGKLALRSLNALYVSSDIPEMSNLLLSDCNQVDPSTAAWLLSDAQVLIGSRSNSDSLSASILDSFAASLKADPSEHDCKVMVKLLRKFTAAVSVHAGVRDALFQGTASCRVLFDDPKLVKGLFLLTEEK